MVHAKCKLCGTVGELELSHFIPKFIGRWLKKTSITGYFRKSNEINKREQDLEKDYWLCGACEDLFSAWETKFANVIFYPFVNDGVSTVRYAEWLPKFCASLTWRTLTYIRSINVDTVDSRENEKYLMDAESHLASYLLSNVDNLCQYEQHLYPLDKINPAHYEDLPVNINRYFLRTTTMDVLSGEGDVYVYTKLPSFLLLGVVRSKHTKAMRASRVSLKAGTISPRVYTFPKGVGGYICSSADRVNEAYSKIKPEDIARLDAYIENNIEKVANSKLLEAILIDYEIFGSASTLKLD